MRFEKLTIKSQEALQEAQNNCAARGHQTLEPVHLLAALFAQPDGSTKPDPVEAYVVVVYRKTAPRSASRIRLPRSKVM